MDLFYTAEWMAKQKQEQKKVQIQLMEMRMRPRDEARKEYGLYLHKQEFADIDLKDRMPGEVFKATVKSGGNSFTLQYDPEHPNRILFLQEEGSLLEAECRGLLGNSFYFSYDGNEFRLRRKLLSRSFVLSAGTEVEKGSICAESIFSDSYRVFLPEQLPRQLVVFIACLVLCDSERPVMPVYNSYWYYG